jgi:hypothetical protein
LIFILTKKLGLLQKALTSIDFPAKKKMLLSAKGNARDDILRNIILSGKRSTNDADVAREFKGD